MLVCVSSVPHASCNVDCAGTVPCRCIFNKTAPLGAMLVMATLIFTTLSQEEMKILAEPLPSLQFQFTLPNVNVNADLRSDKNSPPSRKTKPDKVTSAVPKAKAKAKAERESVVQPDSGDHASTVSTVLPEHAASQVSGQESALKSEKTANYPVAAGSSKALISLEHTTPKGTTKFSDKSIEEQQRVDFGTEVLHVFKVPEQGVKTQVVYDVRKRANPPKTVKFSHGKNVHDLEIEYEETDKGPIAKYTGDATMPGTSASHLKLPTGEVVGLHVGKLGDTAWSYAVLLDSRVKAAVEKQSR